MKPTDTETDTRICIRCGNIKPIGEFKKHINKNKNIGTKQTCNDCNRERNRLNHVLRRNARIEAIKNGIIVGRVNNTSRSPNDTHKVCSICKEDKLMKEFYIDQRSPDLRDNRCKSCVGLRRAEKERNPLSKRKRLIKNKSNRNRAKIKDLIYKGSSCVGCSLTYGDEIGESQSIAQFAFHHVDPTLKTWDIGKLRNVRIDIRRLELDKCIILCHNCHHTFHYYDGVSITEIISNTDRNVINNIRNHIKQWYPNGIFLQDNTLSNFTLDNE